MNEVEKRLNERFPSLKDHMLITNEKNIPIIIYATDSPDLLFKNVFIAQFDDIDKCCIDKDILRTAIINCHEVAGGDKDTCLSLLKELGLNN